MPFTLPTLPFAYNALEPHIDAETSSIHYSKHHQAYVNNLNAAVTATPIGLPDDNASLNALMAKISQVSLAIRNNGGGHWNHSFFWETLTPNPTTIPSNLLTAINTNFQSLDNFKQLFNNAALARFGSGWAWLVKQDNKLVICSTPNQDNPLMDIAEVKGTPILAIDVWEHAYYLKYQNLRANYLNAFWNIVNWTKAAERLG
ncbi:MAG: superoxide dismutase [Alphaproteobacteria bacterium]|nr:superoxide dismutase [Alphaproteobacteria bacterium]